MLLLLNKDINFVETDVKTIENNIITTYEALAHRKLAPADPIKIFLQSIASIIAQQRVLINFTGKQNLLAYASGDFLEGLGKLHNINRADAKSAVSTLKVTLSAPLGKETTIAKGTRVTPDSVIQFATSEDLVIKAGSLVGEASITCLTKGEVGNGWEIGQINKLVDPIPYVQKIENTTVSAGGCNIESDDSLRDRIRNSPESYSTAGPTEGYKYWAKNADTSIIDISVTSPQPGEVLILPLVKTGVPSDEIISIVKEACNDRFKRPLTDKVIVQKPTIVNYNINLTYYIDTSKATVANAIKIAVNEAVQRYIVWQHSKLGRSINESELIARIIKAGAKRVKVVSPSYTQITSSQVAIAENITVNYGGLEND